MARITRAQHEAATKRAAERQRKGAVSLSIEQPEQTRRAYDTSNRPRTTTKASGRRGFYSKSVRWRRESAEYKRARPICEHEGCTDPSAFTDHIQPIKDPTNTRDPQIWDRTNWQALCDYHHRVKTRRELGEAGKLSKMKRARGRRRIDMATGWAE